MHSVSCALHYNLTEVFTWHRQDDQSFMQPKVQYGASSISWSSIPRKGALHVRPRNTKVFALENKDVSQPESAARTNEQVGDKTFHIDNNADLEGSKQDFGSQSSKELSRNEELLQNLKRYGASGVLSYGLLSTVYYLGTFLFVWFYVAPTPGGMGYLAAAQRLLKILAMVWAGSQVTKLLRAGGALALAPSVDQGLSWFTTQFRFKSRGMAFGVIVVTCVAMALSFFIILTILWV